MSKKLRVVTQAGNGSGDRISTDVDASRVGSVEVLHFHDGKMTLVKITTTSKPDGTHDHHVEVSDKVLGTAQPSGGQQAQQAMPVAQIKEGRLVNASAVANDNVVEIFWVADGLIPGCLGFSVRRKDSTGNTTALSAYKPFEGQPDNTGWQARTTDVWPVQRFSWKDLAPPPHAGLFWYEIVPMVGTPDDLKPLEDMKVVTNHVSANTQCGPHIDVTFTRGILSTQALAHSLPKLPDGKPDSEALRRAIITPGDSMRLSLAGNVLAMLKEPILTAKAQGGHVYLALYELADEELIQLILDNKEVVSLILANTGRDDEKNKAGRARLHVAGVDIVNRMVTGQAIGHNKFAVRVDAVGKPVAVTTGSTNWTSTGICAQSNNAIHIRSAELAAIFLEYWRQLKADGSEQGEALRKWCADRKPEVTLSDGTRIQPWFSPNMMDRTKPQHGAPTPPDLEEVFAIMRGAKCLVCFQCFFPGFPSVISVAQELARTRKDLLVWGSVSSSQAMPKEREQAGAGSPIKSLARGGAILEITAAAAFEQGAPGGWLPELLKAGEDSHAIIHGKVVVVDPHSAEDCAVILGSHNLGFKASYSNDENLLIIRGNQVLALAYFLNNRDVYEHYLLRWLVATDKINFTGHQPVTDTWQHRFHRGRRPSELGYYASIATLIG